MAIFMSSQHGVGFASLSNKQREATQQITQLVSERYREEDSERLSAETLLATTAALTGFMARHAFKDIIKAGQPIKVDEFLKKTTALLKNTLTQSDTKKNAFGSLDDFILHTLQNKNFQKSLILTNDPYHNPHEEPTIGAAALREDVLFLGQKFRLKEGDLAEACLYSLAQTASSVVSVLPAEVAYKMAMEVVVGVAYMEPVDRNLVPVTPKPAISHRLVEAGSAISEIFIKQSHSIADGRFPDIPTMVAKAGAFLGEATHKTFIKQPATASYTISADADTFLEECNIHIMASYIRRGGDPKELAEYGEYAANAAASVGHDPYPMHNVKKEYLPHSCPIAEASMAREPVAIVAKKYNLLDWELASACFVAVNDHVRICERFITPPIAVRLAMEEAAAIARVKPVDNWDALMTNAPKDVQEGIQAIKKKAAYGASDHYPHSLNKILNQMFSR